MKILDFKRNIKFYFLDCHENFNTIIRLLEEHKILDFKGNIKFYYNN